jgi:hypothetical protein
MPACHEEDEGKRGRMARERRGGGELGRGVGRWAGLEKKRNRKSIQK